MESGTEQLHQRVAPLNTGRKTTLSEINVTPLVDVFLVLLIIFMVTAPMMEQGIEVNLPEASQQPFQPDQEDRFILSVSLDERVYLNEREIPLEQLEPKLRQLNDSRPIRALFLKADERVSYGAVVRVMDHVKRAGIENLGMVTEPVHETEP